MKRVLAVVALTVSLSTATPAVANPPAHHAVARSSWSVDVA